MNKQTLKQWAIVAGVTATLTIGGTTYVLDPGTVYHEPETEVRKLDQVASTTLATLEAEGITPPEVELLWQYDRHGNPLTFDGKALPSCEEYKRASEPNLDNVRASKIREQIDLKYVQAQDDLSYHYYCGVEYGKYGVLDQATFEKLSQALEQKMYVERKQYNDQLSENEKLPESEFNEVKVIK